MRERGKSKKKSIRIYSYGVYIRVKEFVFTKDDDRPGLLCLFTCSLFLGTLYVLYLAAVVTDLARTGYILYDAYEYSLIEGRQAEPPLLVLTILFFFFSFLGTSHAVLTTDGPDDCLFGHCYTPT